MHIFCAILHWLYPISQGILAGLLAMILHEGGHLLAARLLGVRVKSCSIRWKGLCTIREAGPPVKNLLISLAGPAANVIMMLISHLSPTFGIANACFAFFNILPIEGADGERALRCWLAIRARSNTT
jgi:stage IV sporulation protein FB